MDVNESIMIEEEARHGVHGRYGRNKVVIRYMALHLEWCHTRELGNELAGMTWVDEAFTCLLVYYCGRYVGNSTLCGWSGYRAEGNILVERLLRRQ